VHQHTQKKQSPVLLETQKIGVNIAPTHKIQQSLKTHKTQQSPHYSQIMEVFAVTTLHIDVGGAFTIAQWRAMSREERRRRETTPRFWMNWLHFERNAPSGTFVCCSMFPYEVFTVVSRDMASGTVLLYPLVFHAPGQDGRGLAEFRRVPKNTVFFPTAPAA
jgi:hypothetical protein